MNRIPRVTHVDPDRADVRQERSTTMNRTTVRLATCGALVPLCLVAVAVDAGVASTAQDRVLRKEIAIRAPIEKVWHAWTTAEGLRFVSSKSRVELRLGGPYEWFLDGDPDDRGKRGGAGARVLSFLPNEMLAFTWTFPPSIPSLRHSGASTQVVVLFSEDADGKTRIRFAQHGWQNGQDWDAGYAYFDKAWSYVLDKLRETLETSN
jgi:uncharacterized protein YndB with AHSA1/START domain